MKKTKLLAILMASALTFSCVGMTGCDIINGFLNPETSSSTPAPKPGDSSSQAPEAEDYTVTFRYGFAEGATYDEATKKPSEYAKTLEKESKGGKKVALTSAEKTAFEVEGYTVAGYSTNDWNTNGITADLVVDVLYAPEATYTVSFKNPDGSVIKSISGIKEGESVADSDLPNSKVPVYSITATEYNGMSEAMKALYQAYGETGTYILKAEAERAENTVVIPRGTKFDGWSGSYANIEEDTDITAKTAQVEIAIGGTETSATVAAQQLLDGSVLASSKAIKTSILKSTGANPWLEMSVTVNNTTTENITVDLLLGHGIDWKNGNGKETETNPGEGVWGYEYGKADLFYLFIDGKQVTADELSSITIADDTVWNKRTDKVWLEDLVLTPGKHTVTFMNNGAKDAERPYVFGLAVEIATPDEVEHTHNYDATTKQCECGEYQATPWADFNQFKLGAGTYTIEGYKGTDTVLVIPDEYDGVAVTRLNKQSGNGIRGNTALTKIVLGKNINNIMAAAFAGCTGLKEIMFLEETKITKIETLTFQNCSSLTEIKLSALITSIAAQAFDGCSATIRFAGTKAQWEAITKAEGWNTGFTGTVVCSDGAVA